jgi:hypothetical protein
VARDFVINVINQGQQNSNSFQVGRERFRINEDLVQVKATDSGSVGGLASATRKEELKPESTDGAEKMTLRYFTFILQLIYY